MQIYKIQNEKIILVKAEWINDKKKKIATRPFSLKVVH